MIEHLNGTHYDKGFMQCLSALKKTELTRDAFGDILRHRLAHRVDTVVVVVDDKIVATAAVMVEPKFYGNVGHIEDVATLADYRGRGFGRMAVTECIKVCRDNLCYKVILDCADHNVDWYTKLGFFKFENQMRMNITL
jgi:glucosamine-phosphate N-acetyltransferase